jgi:hypothetical protein
MEQTSSKEKVNVGVSTLPTVVTRLLVNPSYRDDIMDAIKNVGFFLIFFSRNQLALIIVFLS